MLALLPGGDQSLSVAILAGLYAAIFIPLTFLLLGDRNALMYAPRSLVTFLLATVVGGSLAHEHGDQALVLTFLIILWPGSPRPSSGCSGSEP